MTREDGKATPGLNGFEVVQLRALPNTDPTQPTSYIIEPIHCAITTPPYVLQQASPNSTARLVKVTGNGALATRQVVANSAGTNIQVCKPCL